MTLFDLAMQHRGWLAQRQTVVATNIANANTPGYRALGVGDFSRTLAEAGARQSATHPGHLRVAPSATRADLEPAEPETATHSGNTVDVARELTAAGEIHRGYSFNVSIVKTFNRMLLAGVRA